ncbi:hypothetical protein A8M32_25445 [Sinorhizobium alkalisoli]|uniref:2-keto-4-pentenoate hydratase n=1 Tax=Sinorhizobium alkalisoli TaxID=1752398 RepID=A0A1E3V4K7_9HYPH|nr:hypothetical protein A8M32_25445 [Sinorhizobium alkalisoli]
MFSNTELFFGPLAKDEVFVDAAKVPISNLNQPLAEVEIALKIGRWPPDCRSPLFTEMSVCVEIPATVLPLPAKASLLGQVTDRAGAGALWLGEPHPFDARALMSEIKVELSHNDDPVQEGSSLNIQAGPLGVAFEFLALALRYGANLKEGQWIATGGLRPSNPISADTQMAIRHPWGVSSLHFV